MQLTTDDGETPSRRDRAHDGHNYCIASIFKLGVAPVIQASIMPGFSPRRCAPRAVAAVSQQLGRHVLRPVVA